MESCSAAIDLARQIGKGLLLSVAEDLEIEDAGLALSFAVHGRKDLQRVRVVNLGLDRFRIELDGEKTEPLYGYQVAGQLKDRIGEYENPHCVILDIFREAQERYCLDRVTALAYFEARYRARENELRALSRSRRPDASERQRMSAREQTRKSEIGRECACGCGRCLRPSRFPSRARFFSLECVHRKKGEIRTALRRAAKVAAPPRLCACGCGRAIPPTANTSRKFVDRHRSRGHAKAA